MEEELVETIEEDELLEIKASRKAIPRISTNEKINQQENSVTNLFSVSDNFDEFSSDYDLDLSEINLGRTITVEQERICIIYLFKMLLNNLKMQFIQISTSRTMNHINIQINTICLSEVY